MANKQYERVNWAAYPNKSTPITAENLNRMDKGIDNLDTRTTNLENRQDNYESDMTDVKSDVLELTDSLSDIDVRYNPETDKPEWKERGADTYRPFPSGVDVKIVKNIMFIIGLGCQYQIVPSGATKIRCSVIFFYQAAPINLYGITDDLNNKTQIATIPYDNAWHTIDISGYKILYVGHPNDCLDTYYME